MGPFQKEGRKARRMNKEDGPHIEQDRLSAILRGAFSGAPTPLKAIPKRDGKPRGSAKKGQRRLRRQRKNRAA
jgi:hypothetical protein